MLRMLGMGLCLASAGAAATSSSAASFHKDVLPILQKRCQNCHRPGEIGPMPLLTYQQARPWSRAIREVVLLKKMPPWFADPAVGHFSNDARLAKNEIDTLVNWADAGSPEGDPKDAPKPLHFVDGWNIGEPDFVMEMPNTFAVPAIGVVEYQSVIIPTHFKEDRWIQAAEIRPGNRAVVHHVTAFAREPGSRWLSDRPIGVAFQRMSGGAKPKLDRDIDKPQYMVGYTPGRPASEFAPGQARLIKAGSDIVFSLHYTPNGKATEDKTKIGFIFSKQPPKERIVNVLVANQNLVIPPGEPNYRVEAVMTLHEPSTLIRVWPHMHTRGKYFEYRVVYPTGESQVVLRVPRFDFGWQLAYVFDTPMPLPKGTRIEATAYFDNSPNNPHNPDPTAEVRWGDQSWDEMMEGYVDLAVDTQMNPADLTREKPKTD